MASDILDKVLSGARFYGLLPVAVVVLDAGGNMVAMKREDGTGIMRVDVARAKAWGALALGVSSRTLRDRLVDSPSALAGVLSISDGRMAPIPGGVLILTPDKKQVIGAVGVSGDASDRDEMVAIEAVRGAGLLPDPPITTRATISYTPARALRPDPPEQGM